MVIKQISLLKLKFYDEECLLLRSFACNDIFSYHLEDTI